MLHTAVSRRPKFGLLAAALSCVAGNETPPPAHHRGAWQ